MGKLLLTPCATKVVEYAIEEAHNLGHNYVGTEHLLLGLLRDPESTAAKVLVNLGLKLEDVREQILNLLGAEEVEPEPQFGPEEIKFFGQTKRSKGEEEFSKEYQRWAANPDIMIVNHESCLDSTNLWHILVFFRRRVKSCSTSDC